MMYDVDVFAGTVDFLRNSKENIKETVRPRKGCPSPVILWRMPGGRRSEVMWRKCAGNVDLRSGGGGLTVKKR